MKDIISTIFIAALLVSYGEIIVDAIDEQQIKIESQEIEIKSLKQLIENTYFNSSRTSFSHDINSHLIKKVRH